MPTVRTAALIPRITPWSWVVALAGPLLLVLPAALNGLVPLGWDAVLFLAPLLRLTGQLLWQGQLPLWTDALGAGYPLLASTQLWMLYPPAWPMLLWRDPAAALTMFLMLHAAWGGVGGVMLARAARLGPAAAATVGVLCGASLPMMGLFNRPELVCALAWAPWVYATALAPPGDRRLVRRGALALGFNAVVSPQMAAIHGAVAAAMWLWRRPSRQQAGMVAFSGLWTALVAAPTLLPFLEFLPWTDRAGGLDGPRLLGFGLHGAQGLQAVAPALLQLEPWGTTAHLTGIPFAQLLWMAAPWSGPLAVALGAAGMMLRRMRPVAVLAVVLLLLATPDVVPGVTAVWAWPPFNLLRFPAKAWQAGWPLWALLVGAAVEVVAHARRRCAPVVAALLVLSTVTAGLLSLSQEGWAAVADVLAGDGPLPAWLPRHASGALGPTLLWCTGALACVAWPWRRAGVALALVVCAESVWQASGGAAFATLPPASDAPVALAVSTLQPGPARVLNFWSTSNPVLERPPGPGWTRAQRMQVEARHGGGNALLSQGVALEQANMGIRLRGPLELAKTLVDAPARRMTALGSNMLLLGSAFPPVAGAPVAQVWPEAGVSLRVLAAQQPRVRTARRVVVVEDRAALRQAVLHPALDLAQDAVVLGPVDAPAGAPAVSWRMHQDTARLVRFDVDAPQDALVWTADALGPGWDVTVDGAPAQAVAVHGALRGVVVPAGRHVVAWEHSARSLWGGLLVSVLCAVWLGVRGWASRPPPASQYPSPGR